MDVIIGLAIAISLVVVAIKIFRALFRALSSPFRANPTQQAPPVSVRVLYGNEDSDLRRANEKLISDPSKFWIPQGVPTNVAGRQIAGGLIYVGTGLAATRPELGVEAALINPRLKVLSGGSQTGEPPYWPTYERLTPTARGQYLDWLAGDRSDPNISIGLVFLFFYGLERRILVDTQLVDVSLAERRAICEEVQRLISIYGDNGSFASHSRSFLDLAQILANSGPLYELEPPAEGPTWMLPTSVRVAIAQLARDGRPVPAAWAYAWAWSDPGTSVRTAAQRCREELRRLFEIRYKAEFGEGLVVKPNKRTVKIEYRPASPSIGGLPALNVGALPDVTSLTGPIGRIRPIFESCEEDLGAYSRWLGRNEEKRGSLQAAAFLPAELLSAAALGEAGGRLETMIAGRLGDADCAVIATKDLLAFWPAASAGYAKSDMVALLQLLEKFGFGVEPDVRFNGPRLDTVERAVLFRARPGAPGAPTPEYQYAALSLRFAAAVAVADDNITAEEQKSLEAHLAASPSMRPGDHERLRAHLEWLLSERPSLAGIKKKLEALKPAVREIIGKSMLLVAAADGSIGPNEIKTIRKLYVQLGLDPEVVYSELHALSFRGGAATPGPVTVRKGTPTHGYAIGSADETTSPSAAPPRVSLDPELINAKLLESQQAAALLAGIFVDDAEPQLPAAVPEEQGAAGLDKAHFGLLMCMAERDAWTMDEIEAMANERGLFADGALEAINDAAWDSAGDPVFEIAETVTIDKAVLKEMTSQ